MGKRLELFATNITVAAIDPEKTSFRPMKNKRKQAFDIILADAKKTGLVENWESSGADLWQDFRAAFPGFPDALLINRLSRTVYFIEVEDTNPLSEEKLDNYADARVWLDAVKWAVELIVVDRYGANVRVIDLSQWTLSSHFQVVHL